MINKEDKNMDLIKTKKDKTQVHILCKDHVPNFAMKNEFQTNSFSLKMNRLEMHEEEFYGYTIEEGGVFLCVDITIRNLLDQELILDKNEFLISYDNEGLFEPEEYFHVLNQFKDQIQLKPNEQITGKYVYIIAHNSKKITFKYYESYEDQYPKEYRLRYQIKF